jgi:predicted secreted protein
MRPAAILGPVAAALVLAGCGIESVSSVTPTPLPVADVTASYADTKGSFFLGLDQTLLVKLPNAGVHYPQVLTVTSRFADATFLKAVAIGRTTVLASSPTGSCGNECNALAPFEIAVVVVSPADIQQGVTVTEQDHPWVIHMRTGQHFVVSLSNPPAGAAWAEIVSSEPAVLVADQPVATSAAGIRAWFHGGSAGRTAITATAQGCPPGGACPAGYLTFTFVVFA